MSSPTGFRYSQADFLAQWMPSSSRAGVILTPCPELALRYTSAVGAAGSPPLNPDDSFSSDFAPLPASTDSSCVVLPQSPGEDRSGGDRSLNGLNTPRPSDGELDSVDEMSSSSQEPPLVMKLEQLRKWQQHMQEQLQAHQLEELLRLQEEQHRLLDHTMRSGVSGAERRENILHSSTSNSNPRQKQEQIRTRTQWPRSCPSSEEEDDWVDGKGSSRDDEQDESSDSWTADRRRKDDATSQDRPIRPGIGGRKQTFEELLEEQLRLEEQRLKSVWKQQSQGGGEVAQVPPKKTFLKRGEGLSRFTKTHNKPAFQKKEAKKDPKPRAHVISRSNSEPAAIRRGTTHRTQRLPVQRKTAILHKESRVRRSSSPPDLRAESTRAHLKGLGCHERQTSDGAESVQTETDGRRTKPLEQVTELSRSSQPNPVTKQLGVSGDIVTEDRGDVGSGGGRGEVPQDSFELSFQDKVQRWECDQQLENMELGEFELLEQAAEELSFSSNSSFVMKVLQMDQQHRKLQDACGLHLRRLSSTPIKSPPRGEPRRSRSVGSDVSPREDTVKSGGSVEDKEQRDIGDGCSTSSRGSCSTENQEAVVKPPAFPSSLCFPAPLNPPYDKRSYEDEDSCRDSEGTHGGDGESDADDSTIIEDNGDVQGGVVFDDDDTWNDPEDAADGVASDGGEEEAAKELSPPERTVLRKAAGTKVVELGKGAVYNSANQEFDPPASSKLMMTLFPSLRPTAQNPPPPPDVVHAAAPEPRKAEEQSGQQVQSLQLRERLAELEIEIERFKKENIALSKLRQENEKMQENLRKERLEFEQAKADELAKFEEYKKEQNRKLLKERKLFEKHASAARAIPDKKEREEIQALKQQLSSLQEEMRRRESRWSATHSRLRQQIDTLGEENQSLQDEVCMLEKLRLSALKKTSVDEERDRDVKDVPSGAKGVKFASPLDSRGGSPPQSSTAAAIHREGGHMTTGIKSSLRRSGGPPSSSTSSSSSSALGRKQEDKITPGLKNSDKPTNPEQSHSSSQKRDSLPKDADGAEAREPQSSQDVITHPDGKTETLLAGGNRLITFPNGTRKEVSADGLTVKVTFFNGDTKQITADQRVIYYYAEAQTTHTTYPDGMEVLHFPNNQTEKHFPDGRKEITFPDQTVKNLFPCGREESVLTDGTIIQVNPDGTKEIHFNTGQKEVHTADYKRREYPDGTVKTVYSDGRQETHYPTGRLRIKDKDGNVVVDNRM